MGRKAKAAAAAAEAAAVAAAAAAAEAAAAAAIACGESLTSRKRGRSGETKLTSTSKNPVAVSIDPRSAKYEREILVLFETLSGFAIFSFKEYYLDKPKAMEKIWAIFGKDYRAEEIVCLKDFRTFKNKSSVINRTTGVNKKLTEMILRHHRHGQTLAVGKPEYKTIIETSLWDVPCRFDETVMEVMWGLQNLMHSFLPEEVKLMNEDRLPMCQGIKIFLDRYGFNVKPEMVSEKVIEMACLLFDAELLEKRYSKSLHLAAAKLKDLSGINYEGWSLMKIATALKIMVKPIATSKAEMELFTTEELSTFLTDKYKYEGLISRDLILRIHNRLWEIREVIRKDCLEILGRLL